MHTCRQAWSTSLSSTRLTLLQCAAQQHNNASTCTSAQQHRLSCKHQECKRLYGAWLSDRDTPQHASCMPVFGGQLCKTVYARSLYTLEYLLQCVIHVIKSHLKIAQLRKCGWLKQKPPSKGRRLTVSGQAALNCMSQGLCWYVCTRCNSGYLACMSASACHQAYMLAICRVLIEATQFLAAVLKVGPAVQQRGLHRYAAVHAYEGRVQGATA